MELFHLFNNRTSSSSQTLPQSLNVLNNKHNIAMIATFREFPNNTENSN
jgi:hypothetical protein